MHVLKISYRDRESFLEVFKREETCPTVFVPTTKKIAANDQLILVVLCKGFRNKTLLRATVLEQRTAIPRLSIRAGVTISVHSEEAHKWKFVLDVLEGQCPDIDKRKHLRYPVDVPVRYQIAPSTEWQDGRITEISVGGALLCQPCPAVERGTKIITEIILPDEEGRLTIHGQIAYSAAVGLGIQYVYRDAAVRRRLVELIRRMMYGREFSGDDLLPER